MTLTLVTVGFMAACSSERGYRGGALLRQCNVAVTTRNKGVMRKPYDFMRGVLLVVREQVPPGIDLVIDRKSVV